MSSLTYTTSSTRADLLGIIALQKKNLRANLTPQEISSEGFVTVVHTLDDLETMNNFEQHVIAKENDNVIAYLLAMTEKSKNDLPVLIPMFEQFEKLTHRGKFISEQNYIVVGQVCVDKRHRGTGVLDRCYEEFKNIFKEKYDFGITEIATTNRRSLNAHQRIGFKEICRYHDTAQTEWSIVVWDW